MSSPPSWDVPMPELLSHPTVAEIENAFKEVQDVICEFLVDTTGDAYHEDLWDYDKGSGGGRTRVWENGTHLEKAGVNWSGIAGENLPSSAQKAFNIEDGTPYTATGVSLVIHPVSPMIPTVHMNIRYFAAGDHLWWFGGGVDVTPYYPDVDKVVQFHKMLRHVCEAHGMSYDEQKKTCDEYFFLSHRDETRGVGGLFFDHLNSNKGEHLKYAVALGKAFVSLYGLFLNEASLGFSYTAAQREFQLYRRGRYVEFNLLFDRGTKFGIQSNGRTESILMSLPSVVHWKYGWSPEPGTAEAQFYEHFLKPQPWLELTDEQKDAMRLDIAFE